MRQTYLAICLLLAAVLPAQDEASIGNADWSALGITEARFPVSADNRWSLRGFVIHRREDVLRNYGNVIAGPEIHYAHPKWGEFSTLAFYIDATGEVAGALVRTEWQKIWVRQRLAPLLNARVERLSISNTDLEQRLLLTWRFRVRAGVVPKIGEHWRALAIAEWFPYQTVAGFSEEYRSVAGFTVDLNPNLGVAFGHLSRFRPNVEMIEPWIHTLFVKLTYTHK